MAIESRISLLKSLEKSLGSIATANQLAEIMSAVSDELAKYRVETMQGEQYEPDDFLDAFLTAKQIEGCSEKTVERYRYIITRLMDSVRVPTRNVTVFHLRKYLNDEKTRGIADSTLKGFREIFSAYFGWLQKENLIDMNPCYNLGVIKCQKKVKLAYSDIDLEKIKSNCKTIRDKAIVCFLLSTGCRISEMTKLNRDDIDLKNMECKVLGKGNKERIVYLDAVTCMLIGEYIGARKDELSALFIGKKKERLKPGGVRAMLIKIQKRAKIETTVHPHRFRRTLATNLIHRGMPIQEVAHILGHEKLDTTMKYVCMNEMDIKYSYNKYM